MNDNKYNFLRAQVKMFNPNFTDKEIDKECQRILNEGEGGEDPDCLYCGS
jgi:predicted Zn-dependent peptidase